MPTFIKAKLNKSDDQMNIDKYRVLATIISRNMTLFVTDIDTNI